MGTLRFRKISECHQIICWSYKSRRRTISQLRSQIAKFMGPTWGPPGSCRPQMGPMLAPWTLLSGIWMYFNQVFQPTDWILSSLPWKELSRYQRLLDTDRYMMTPSNGNLFRVTGLLCGEFTGHWWIPRTKTSGAELWCFLWSAPNKQLSKQWWDGWFEKPSRPLWRHCNDLCILMHHSTHQRLFWWDILTESLVLLWSHHHDK